jgi:hypothetical protein
VEYIPAGQTVHILDPDAEKLPALQSRQTAWLNAARSDEYLPAVQEMQAEAPLVTLYVPAGQGAQFTPVQFTGAVI